MPAHTPQAPPAEVRSPSPSGEAVKATGIRRRRRVMLIGFVVMLLIGASIFGWIVRKRLGSSRNYVLEFTVEHIRYGEWDMVLVSIQYAITIVVWALKDIFLGS